MQLRVGMMVLITLAVTATMMVMFGIFSKWLFYKNFNPTLTLVKLWSTRDC